MLQSDKIAREHGWIEREKQLFGIAGTPFEFKKGDAMKDPDMCHQRLGKLTAAQERLSKTVNMKVLSMFGKTEKSAEELLKKKKIVEADKAKVRMMVLWQLRYII